MKENYFVVAISQRPHQRVKSKTCLSFSERQRFSRQSLKDRVSLKDPCHTPFLNFDNAKVAKCDGR